MASSSSNYAAQIDLYVDRLPRPISSGQHKEAEDNDTTHRCLQNMLRDCLKERSHIMPLWNFLDDRKRKYAVAFTMQVTGEMFETASSLASVKERYFFVAWIAVVSDCSETEILNITIASPNSLEEMIVRGAGLSWHQKLPDQCEIRDVMRALLNHRHDHLGKPLATLKASHALASGRVLTGLDWKKAGVYTPTYAGANSELSKIDCAASGFVDVDAGVGISKAWGLVDNHDMFGATFQFGNLKPQKVIDFWDAKKKTGPHAFQSFVGRPRELTKLVEQLAENYKKYQEEKMRQVAGSSQLKNGMAQARKAKAKAAMAKARAAADKVLAEKEKRRTVTF